MARNTLLLLGISSNTARPTVPEAPVIKIIGFSFAGWRTEGLGGMAVVRAQWYRNMV
jgi:hypothetical protein